MRWPVPEIPFSDAPRGTCRWCGEVILKSDGNQNCRRRWHPECEDAFHFQIYPQVARWRVWERDRGVCAECGVQSFSGWEADHIEPIWAGGRHDMSNLQTLCSGCHKEKTAGEAKQRAAAKREAACQMRS
jgi:5-methylcytosine-specific restriction endonuclease McrA